ncbi:MAG: hypothetical protein LBS30_05395 [Planctomycetota bacterium]|jgi:hypothetical protein|nr:hypothetical protein [Planctomycetota bacterium]
MENSDVSDGVKVILPPEPVSPAFERNNIPVFLGCDDRFFPHAVTTIASLMAHADPDNNYDIFIVQDGIAPGRLAMAAAWMRQFPNASLRFVDIRPLAEAEGKEAFATHHNLSYAAYFRIFAPEKKPWTRYYTGHNARYYWDCARATPFFRESLERLKRECALGPTLGRKLLLAAQSGHFRLRALFAPAEKRERYKSRLHNLFLRGKGLDSQRALIRELESGAQPGFVTHRRSI